MGAINRKSNRHFVFQAVGSQRHCDECWRDAAYRLDLIQVHSFLHYFSLGVHLYGGGRQCFSISGILLCGLIYLGNRLIDLFDTLGLFSGGCCDLLNQLAGTGRFIRNFIKGNICF